MKSSLTHVGRSGQARTFRVANDQSLSKVNHWIITHPPAAVTSTENHFASSEWSNRGSSLSLGASGLYSMARCLIDVTQRDGSYTVCFAIKEGSAPAEERKESVVSSRPPLLHVVERVENDYNPNNQVYHQMRLRNSEWEEVVSVALVKTAEAESRAGDLSVAEKNRQLLAAQQAMDDNGSPIAQATDGEEEEEEQIDVNKDAAEMVNLTAKMPSPEAAALGEQGDNKEIVYFWPHQNSTNSVAYMGRHFMVLVNLKPAVEGHLLIVPKRIVTSIHDLGPGELIEWATVVKLSQQVLWRAYVARSTASAEEAEKKQENTPAEHLVADFSVAIQQGTLSNQTVPHLHTHVIVFKPDGRLAGEPEQGDEETWNAKKCRTRDEMAAEAQLLRKYFEVEKVMA